MLACENKNDSSAVCSLKTDFFCYFPVSFTYRQFFPSLLIRFHIFTESSGALWLQVFCLFYKICIKKLVSFPQSSGRAGRNQDSCTPHGRHSKTSLECQVKSNVEQTLHYCKIRPDSETSRGDAYDFITSLSVIYKPLPKK